MCRHVLGQDYSTAHPVDWPACRYTNVAPWPYPPQRALQCLWHQVDYATQAEESHPVAWCRSAQKCPIAFRRHEQHQPRCRCRCMQISLLADGCRLIASDDMKGSASEPPQLGDLPVDTDIKPTVVIVRPLSGCQDGPPCLSNFFNVSFLHGMPVLIHKQCRPSPDHVKLASCAPSRMAYVMACLPAD